MQPLVNPRRACTKVAVVVFVCVCVCVCVCDSVTALAASMSAYICNQRYSQVVLSILTHGLSKKPSFQKCQYAN